MPTPQYRDANTAYNAISDAHARDWGFRGHRCECGRTFTRPQGLGLHLGAVARQASAAWSEAWAAADAARAAARIAATAIALAHADGRHASTHPDDRSAWIGLGCTECAADESQRAAARQV